MDASTAVRTRAWPTLTGGVPVQLARAIATSLLALLGVSALLVCLRRASGALVEPLPLSALLGCAAFVALAAAAYRALSAASEHESRGALLLRWAAPSLVALLWAIAMTTKSVPTDHLLAVWAILGLSEGASWWRLVSTSQTPRRVVPVRAAVMDAGISLEDPPEYLPEYLSSDETISQHMVRRREAGGSERIDGWVRIEFAPLERHANAHLAICPALAVVPQCFAEQSDGPSCEIKVGQVLTYGVRLEIKLDEPAVEATSVVVEFSLQESVEEE